MSRGGYRPGAGRKKGSTAGSKVESKAVKKDKVPTLPPEDAAKAEALDLTPLAYMLKIMNDINEDDTRRDRMAALAAPFCHPRAGENKGKKEDKEDRAKSAARGRFAPGSAPLKVVK